MEEELLPWLQTAQLLECCKTHSPYLWHPYNATDAAGLLMPPVQTYIECLLCSSRANTAEITVIVQKVIVITTLIDFACNFVTSLLLFILQYRKDIIVFFFFLQFVNGQKTACLKSLYCHLVFLLLHWSGLLLVNSIKTLGTRVYNFKDVQVLNYIPIFVFESSRLNISEASGSDLCFVNVTEKHTLLSFRGKITHSSPYHEVRTLHGYSLPNFLEVDEGMRMWYGRKVQGG